MAEDLKKYIRSIKDFPKPGIVFRDITTLLKEPKALKDTLIQLYEVSKDSNISKVCGIESRGFMFGSMVAERLNVGFVPIRKPGKLPGRTEKQVYELEYGTDAVEIHTDAITKGDRILLHDDLLATGGTARASADLIERLGGKVVQISFIIELGFLKGRDKLKGYDVRS
ncbi:MAG TPA: adenine phosphoribosyltransferase, partial [Ignavibacteriaceae bacterium]|nr:adenine phosphoribosyltransferase [Ignavibacteriaceae bacterium]